jgi:hypothetical protein
MISKRQNPADLTGEMLEKQLIDGTVYPFDKQRKLGGRSTADRECLLLAAAPLLLRLVAIADNVVLFAVQAGRLGFIALLLPSSYLGQSCSA